MTIPTPHEPTEYEFKPLPPKPETKPNLKDFDHEANWKQSPTNPDVQINIIIGRLRTKDFSKPPGNSKSV